MQTTKNTTAIPSAYSKDSRRRTKQFDNSSGYKPKRATHSSPYPTSKNSFLKTIFQPIPAYLAGCGLSFTLDQIQKLRSNTPAYIVATANNYLKLMGIEKLLQSTGNLDKDCVSVHNTLSKALPLNQSLSFEFYQNQFSICITQSYWSEFPDWELFYLPISGVEEMCPKTANLFKQFISYYAQSQHISFPADHNYFASILNDEFVSDDDNVLIEEVELYTNGKAGQTFQEIQELHISPDALKAAILANIESSESDKELLNLMIEGIDLLRTDSMFNYSRQYETEDYYGEFINLFAIVWKIDEVVNYAVEYANSDLQELPIFPMAECFRGLTPTDKELFQKSTFPVDFSEWWYKFNEILSNYE